MRFAPLGVSGASWTIILGDLKVDGHQKQNRR
jgi:hypothetical protein